MTGARCRLHLIRIAAAAAAIFMLFSGCALNPDQPDETTTETPQSTTTTTTAYYQPGDLTPSPLTIYSTDLVDDGETAFYADPATGYLTAVGIFTGETRTLLETPISSELILSGSRIFFREAESGRIGSVLTNGTLYRSGYKMPFESGVMYEGTIFFVEDTLTSDDCILYSYSPLEGEWSTTILSGCEGSLSRSTLVFDSGCLYYIQAGTDADNIMQLSLDTLEKTKLYTSEGRVGEILCHNGVLYFRDTGLTVISSYADGVLNTYIDTDAERIFAVLTDGLLYGSAEFDADNIRMGNAEGQETVCIGGEILAYSGSRAIFLRAHNKIDRLCVVKYPEDEVQYYVDGTLYCVLSGENYALVVMCGEEKRYIISFSDGSVLELTAEPIDFVEVGLDEYIAAIMGERVIPSVESLSSAEPAKLADVFASALAKSDRVALNCLLKSAGIRLAPYTPLYFKSWTTSRLPSYYEIELMPYFATDLSFVEFLPAILRSISVKVNGIEMLLPFYEFLEQG